MRKKRFLLVVGLSLSAIYLAGCEETVNTVSNVSNEIEAIYEGETSVDPDPNLAHNDSYFIEQAHGGYIDVLAAETIGNIFSDSLFSDLVWSVDEYANIIINGYYNGEIFPGDDSHLQFTLSEVAQGQYTIIDLEYNGETVPTENYYAVTDIISDAISW